MSLKKAIQDRITDAVASGTFHAVSYGEDRKPVLGSETAPNSIAVNEINASSVQSARANARTGQQSLSNWLFEARARFDTEVDVSKFLTEQLKTISFNHENTVRVRAVPGAQMAHPPRHGSGGTELVLTFTINTKY